MMSDTLSRHVSRGIAALAVGAAIYYALFGGEYRLTDVEELRETVESRAAELAELQAELDSLRAWGDSLVDDPWVIERVARERYGFVRPGEIVFRFVDSSPEDVEVDAG